MIDQLVLFLLPFASYLAKQCLYGGLYFLFCLPLLLFFKNRFPQASQLLVWLLLLRLLIPVEWSLPLPFSTKTHATLTQALPTLDVSADEASTTQEGFSSFNPVYYLLIPLLTFWLCCATFILIEWRNTRAKLWKCAQSNTAQNQPGLTVVEKWRLRFAIKRKVRLCVSDEASFVYTIGHFQPVIVIPRTLYTSLNAFQLEAIIAHEMGHISRCDDFFLNILIAFKALFFFFPPLHFYLKSLHQSRECLCDSKVLSFNTINASQYAQGLLDVSAKTIDLFQAHAFSASPQLGEYQMLKNRLIYLKSGEKNSRRSLAGLLLATFFGVALFCQAETEAPHKEGFSLPVSKGWVSSHYGLRSFPTGKDKGKTKFHNGIDIAGNKGTKVSSIASGVVTVAVADMKQNPNPKYGLYLEIQHADGFTSRYMHLDALSVKKGDTLKAGQTIGKMGNSGQATGPHLHLEIWRQGEAVNPAELIAFDALK